jgi:anti-sigma-K factor RskA
VSCPQLTDVGAYVLDALEPDERERLEEHLPGCPACAAELRELSGLPALLATVPAPAVSEPVPVPSELAFRRLRSATGAGPVRHRARPRPARRWLLAAAAAVVVGGAAAGAVAATSRGTPAPETVTASAGALHVTASISPAATGSRISLALNGVPEGQQCELTVQARDGHWETASRWTADYEGEAHVTGSVRIAPHDLQRLVVRTLDGRTLLSVAA